RGVRRDELALEREMRRHGGDEVRPESSAEEVGSFGDVLCGQLPEVPQKRRLVHAGPDAHLGVSELLRDVGEEFVDGRDPYRLQGSALVLRRVRMVAQAQPSSTERA